MFDLSKYMNLPECKIEVGKVYERTDYFLGGKCKVLEISFDDGYYYARCECLDEFSGEKTVEKVRFDFLE